MEVLVVVLICIMVYLVAAFLIGIGLLKTQFRSGPWEKDDSFPYLWSFVGGLIFPVGFLILLFWSIATLMKLIATLMKLMAKRIGISYQ